jgi:TolB-like protein
MQSDRLPRKLAAILYADVAGYSRLTGNDEDATHRTLSGHLDSIAATIDKHGGRVMHYAGDAVLAMFDAVVNAMQAAIDIQEDLFERNSPVPADRRVQFRIGMNLGDVIEDRGDIYGDGVNVAARLEALAEPGGICVSEAIRAAIGNKLPVQFQFMGEQRVKNITDAIRAYRVSVQGDEPALRSEPANELLDLPSIAILPMTNMGGDSADDVFCDGIAEDIITALSKLSGLMVVARNSSFAYRGESADLGKISRGLGVRYVLEGSMRRAGERFRINTQLVDTTTGHHLWADRYDREAGDIFAIQDEMTREITTALRVKLTDGEQARIWAGRTKSLDAWELTARAWQLANRHRREDTASARALAQRAISLDPSYAIAHVVVGWSHWSDYFNGWTTAPENSFENALTCAERALEIDLETPDAHSLLSLLHLEREEHALAVSESERATELAPGHSFIVAVYAMVLVFSGEPEQALRMVRKAIHLCPLYPVWYLMIIARYHKIMGDYAQAESVLHDALERDPDFYMPYVLLAEMHAERNDSETASRFAEQVLRINPSFTITQWQRGRRYRDKGLSKRECEALQRAGLPP